MLTLLLFWCIIDYGINMKGAFFMKKSFLDRAAAFVVAFVLMVGGVSALPEECFSLIGAVVRAEEAATSGQCGDDVFWELDSNGTLTISGSGEMYDYEVSPFFNRVQIHKIVIKDGVTRIGNNAFVRCLNLTIVTIPNSVTSIGRCAFSNCSSLNNITIPNGVTSIEQLLFAYCTALTNISIPNSVTSIGNSAFLSCKGLTDFTIPSNIKIIGETAFADCSELKNVIISDGVKIIGDCVFQACEKLTNVTIADSVTDIGYYIFEYCSNLKSITIPGSITKIQDYAFLYCSNLTNVSILEGVTEINFWSFGNCNNLRKIVIPKSVTYIDVLAFENSSNLTIYGYTNSYAETYAKDNNIPFVALDSGSNFTSATMTQYTSPVNVGDELLFNVVIRDSNGNPVNISDLSGELTYTTSVSDNNCIRIDRESTDLTGAFIKATAVGEGTATVTVSFSNGVSATSTVVIKNSGTSEDEYDTVSDSRYDKLYLTFDPANISYTYNANTQDFDKTSTDCTISFSSFELVDVGHFMDISKIDIKLPKGFTSNSLSQLEFTYENPFSLENKSGSKLTEKFTLTVPTKEFLEGNPVTNSYTPEMVITVYGDNGFVKTFKQDISVKYVSSGSEIGDPIPDNVIVIDNMHNSSEDIIVSEGEYVVIRSQYGSSYNAEINCRNLYVNGGICKIVGTATLNVSGNAEVTGGKTNWLNPISSDKEGGVLEVDGKLNISGNMLVGEDCGILNMTKSSSMVDVKGNFKITTNSTKYICNLSNGILKIGGSFESSGKYSGNFQATDSHLTLFYGNDFDITLDKSQSYFKNISFTENALNSVTRNDKLKYFKLYSSNVKGKFYLYGKNTDLSYLFEDHEEVISTIVGAYNDYLSDSQFKKSMSGLRKYLSDDYYDKIVADVMMFCELENLAISTGSSEYGIDLIGPWKNYLDSSDNLTGALAIFANGKTLLSFSMDDNPDIYICLSWLGSSLGSSNSGASSASCFFVRWIVDDNGTYCANENIISLSYTDLNNLTNQLVQVYKDSTKTNGTVGDFNSWFQDYILGTYKDLNMVYNGLTFQKGELDLSKAQNISTWCNKVYKAITTKNLKGFLFQIQSPFDALKVPDKITQFVKSDMTSKDVKILFTCPVNVEIKNSLGEIVASVIDNKVIVSSDEAMINVVNGDQKQCVFHSLDDFSITLTATDDGTMSYYIYELENSNATRTITFKDIPLNKGIIYTGRVNNYNKKETPYFSLTDSNGKIFVADSDVDHYYYMADNTNSSKNEFENNFNSFISHSSEFISTSSSNPHTRQKLTLKTETSPDSIRLSWNKISGAKKYTVYIYRNSRYEKLKDTAGTSFVFKNPVHGKTYRFLVRYSVNGRLSAEMFSGKVTVTVYLKPVVTAYSGKNSIKLSWKPVSGAEKYAVYRYKNGRGSKITETENTYAVIKKMAIP